MFGVMNRVGLTSRGDALGRVNARWNGFGAGMLGGAAVAIEHKARRILLALYVGQKAVDVLLRAVAEQASKPAGENFKVRVPHAVSARGLLHARSAQELACGGTP